MQKVFSDQVKIRRALRIGDLLGYFLATLAAALLIPGDLPFNLLTVVEMYLPFALVWMVIAPFAGLFRASIALRPSRLWLAALLTIVGTPAGAWIAKAWIGTSFEPVFIAVLTILATLIITGWRYAFIVVGKNISDEWIS